MRAVRVKNNKNTKSVRVVKESSSSKRIILKNKSRGDALILFCIFKIHDTKVIDFFRENVTRSADDFAR